MDSPTKAVTFSFVCSLFREIAKLKPISAVAARKRKRVDNERPVLQIFDRWLTELRKRFGPLPPGTTAVLLRLILPQEDHKRKYGIQESRLVGILAKCYGVDKDRFLKWNHAEGSGCLGHELKSILDFTNTRDENYISPLSIFQVDQLLDELASQSSFTDASIREKYPDRRKQQTVFRALFRDLSPEDAGFLAQIILKDLRPMLYPLGKDEDRFMSALRDFNTKSFSVLSRYDVMLCWDPHSKTMINASRVFSDMDRVAEIYEMDKDQRPKLKPVVGTMVEIPKSKKAIKCGHALEFIKTSHRAWAEIKYDGERAQIHVQLRKDDKPKITIFSKSKRDSTLDRFAVHDVICEALGIREDGSASGFNENVILDAEMVAFNGTRIDEFWRIRSLVESTAIGTRHNPRVISTKDFPPSQQSMLSEHESEGDDPDDESYETQSEGETPSRGDRSTPAPPRRRLGLVFFDVLLVDNNSCLFWPYSERRPKLESLISVIPGRALLASRHLLDLTESNDSARAALRHIFAWQCADHQEGLVIKADESIYNDYKFPWVKLKKDYIEGYGDTLDLVLVGAAWEKDRGRNLHVKPDTYTTFYLGASNNPKDPKPHVEVWFTVYYGLSRQQLLDINLKIKASDSLPYSANAKPKDYTFEMFKGIAPPSVMLQTPISVTVFGAGFTKSRGATRYELRFPRMQMKSFSRRDERHWTDAHTILQLMAIARTSVGRDKEHEDIEDDTTNAFNKWNEKVAQPKAKDPLKRKEVAKALEEILREIDQDDDSDLGNEEWETPESFPIAKRPRKEVAGTNSQSDNGLPSEGLMNLHDASQPDANDQTTSKSILSPPPSSPLMTVTNKAVPLRNSTQDAVPPPTLSLARLPATHGDIPSLRLHIPAPNLPTQDSPDTTSKLADGC